jgi:hypothetical protein
MVGKKPVFIVAILVSKSGAPRGHRVIVSVGKLPKLHHHELRNCGEECFSKKNEVFLEEEEMSKHAKRRSGSSGGGFVSSELKVQG